MKISVTLFIIMSLNMAHAQYNFEGYIDKELWKNEVFLSVIDDYRTLNGINNEQIISKTSTDASGKFIFSGNQLDHLPRIYKLHVDNCESNTKISNHFSGHCSDSKSILFIAKNNDSISFPLSFDGQMFCNIKSINPKSIVFNKIQLLIEDMKFAYAEFDSKVSRDLNNKKWFKTLQDYGLSLNEPLAELYIYRFLSDRTNQFHDYYLEDLKLNNYYRELLLRLKENYPNSSYTKQYEAELKSDLFIISEDQNEKSSSTMNYVLFVVVLLILSVIANILLFKKFKNNKVDSKNNLKKSLTKQEKNVLDLILENNSNKEIASLLFVSLSTVKTHINNLYKKLNVNSREELKQLFTSVLKN